jgi:hypothetical protein
VRIVTIKKATNVFIVAVLDSWYGLRIDWRHYIETGLKIKGRRRAGKRD